MQIDLTFRNSPRNVKRRLLHTWGFVMYYITRRCSGVAMERRKSTPNASPSVLVMCVCPLSAPSSFLLLWLEYLPILLGICWGFVPGFCKNYGHVCGLSFFCFTFAEYRHRCACVECAAIAFLMLMDRQTSPWDRKSTGLYFNNPPSLHHVLARSGDGSWCKYL